MTDSYDVVVIGGGAAGLSGAVALARSRRSVLLVDAGDPRNAPAGHVHNFLTRDGTPPAEIYELGRAEVARYGGDIQTGRVTGLDRIEDGFRVAVGDRTVTARRLLVATGLRDELPEVPGLSERWGIDVLHCPYCHGWEVARPAHRRPGHQPDVDAPGPAVPAAEPDGGLPAPHRPGARRRSRPSSWPPWASSWSRGRWPRSSRTPPA